MHDSKINCTDAYSPGRIQVTTGEKNTDKANHRADERSHRQGNAADFVEVGVVFNPFEHQWRPYG